MSFALPLLILPPVKTYYALLLIEETEKRRKFVRVYVYFFLNLVQIQHRQFDCLSICCYIYQGKWEVFFPS